MLLRTPLDSLAFVVTCLSSLFLVGMGVWIWRRVKSPCLPWAIACWVINSSMLHLLNRWLLGSLGSAYPDQAVSIAPLVALADAVGRVWLPLLSSASYLAILLLVAADAALLVHQLKPQVNDRVPQVLGLVRRFSSAFGFLALVLAIMNHIVSLLVWLR